MSNRRADDLMRARDSVRLGTPLQRSRKRAWHEREMIDSIVEVRSLARSLAEHCLSKSISDELAQLPPCPRWRCNA